MKKVIVSVDKRKQFNNIMAPTSLGIQAIVIGPGYHEDEEVKEIAEEQTPFLTQPDLNLNQSHLPRSAKLEPLNTDCMPNSEFGDVSKESVNELLTGRDLEGMFKKKSSNSNIITESQSKRREESDGKDFNNIEIQDRYDNQTTQNL